MQVFRRADTNSVHYQQDNCGTQVPKNIVPHHLWISNGGRRIAAAPRGAWLLFAAEQDSSHACWKQRACGGKLRWDFRDDGQRKALAKLVIRIALPMAWRVCSEKTFHRKGVSSDGAGGARRGACCWLARRSPRLGANRNSARSASGVTANRMTRTRRGGRRVRNGPRRACARWTVKRHFGHSPHDECGFNATVECPKCRFGGGAVCWSRPVPHLCGAARWT